MKQKPSSRRRRRSTKSVLRLPDLEHAKAAVLNSLNSADAKRGYRHAIDEFVDWYCSEPRLAFNRIVVLRYRCHLESRQLAPGTINLRLGAVRRLAYEAADCGLLSAVYIALGAPLMLADDPPEGLLPSFCHRRPGERRSAHGSKHTHRVL